MTEARPQLFGHPRALWTLFFTELWERFSYYGMRAILLIYMVDSARGGMAMTQQTGSAVYGLYTFGAYAMALPGGWIADRILGQKRAVLWGGIIIALGHFSLAVPNDFAFFLGLFLVVTGTGLLKPNVSAVVGDLYPEGGARRDAGFSIFYSGINIGAFAGPLVCGYFGEVIDWHLGFGAAGIGMTFAVIMYLAGLKGLEGAGEVRAEVASAAQVASAKSGLVKACFGVVVVVAILWGLTSAGVVGITLVGLAQVSTIVVVILVALYFSYLITRECRDTDERKRIGLCAILFVGAAFFWSAFEQAGTSLTLFAQDFTDRSLFSWEVPVSYLQSVNPLFIILLAPVMGSLWVWLDKRNPSVPVKFGAGLVLLGAGFLVLAWGATYTTGGAQVGMQWLVVTYFLHTVGELCLSPVGLSGMTKFAPERLVGQMMGTWFMGSALGNLIAGLVGGYIETMPPSELFGVVATIVIVAGLVFLVLFKPIKSLGGSIE